MLQADWNEFGEDAFEFETLEDVVPRTDPNYDYAADLEMLEDLWLEKLEPYGDKGYNERKKTREERLQMIAANRKLLKVNMAEKFLMPKLSPTMEEGQISRWVKNEGDATRRTKPLPRSIPTRRRWK